MLLMQIVNSLVRQWREVGLCDRILSACFLSGVIIGLAVSSLAGSIMVAVSFGLLVLLRTGLLMTRRQRKMRNALEPLQSLRLEEQQRENNIVTFASQLNATQPPSNMWEGHLALMRTVEELIEARGLHREDHAINRYVAAVVALRSETASWSRLVEDVERQGGERASYVHKIRDAIHRYYARDEEIAANRHSTFNLVVARLEEIAPVGKGDVVRHNLVNAIVGMDELATRQRLYLGKTDEAGAVKTAGDLVASRVAVEKAIRRSVRT
jgi:hypothetical protein